LKANGAKAPTPPVEIPVPKGESAYALTERDIPEPVRLCDPWAVEGVNIIAGRPKLGKTTLERQKLAAAAVGADFLDSKFPNPVYCAFLSLEEGELLCRAKFRMAGFPEAALAGIQLFFEWPRGESGVELLDRYLREHPEVRLVVIDSLTRFRVVPDVRVPAFMADYEAINGLHDLSKRHPGVCIDVIHHTRKARGDDPIDDISGTYGLTAACDAYYIMRYHADGAILHAGGRLWTRDDSQFTMKKGDSQTWIMLGPHLDITEKQKECLEMVKAASIGGLSGKDLSDKLHITIPSAWQRLDELLEKGFVTKRHGRCYAK
jgi:hypothetical protein